MLRERNECIATRAFAAMILDYEFPASDLGPACVSCRVLIEDVYQTTIHAASRAEAVEMFNTGKWKEM